MERESPMKSLIFKMLKLKSTVMWWERSKKKCLKEELVYIKGELENIYY